MAAWICGISPRAGHRDRLAHQQELLGDGGLPASGWKPMAKGRRHFGGLVVMGNRLRVKKGGEYSANSRLADYRSPHWGGQ